MAVWFTSDTHFLHGNVILYSKRPFKDVTHMTEELVRRWNERVAQNDTVYHLGDFGMGSKTRLQPIMDRLQGRKCLIEGNHDRDSRKLVGWAEVHKLLELTLQEGLDSTRLVLCHYSMRVWNRSHHGAIQLYGHSHGNLPGNSQSLDVGVDCWDYAPVNLAQIKRRMATLPPYHRINAD